MTTGDFLPAVGDRKTAWEGCGQAEEGDGDCGEDTVRVDLGDSVGEKLSGEKDGGE